MTTVVAIVLSAVAAAASALFLIRHPGPFTARNYRGTDLPAVLGIAVACGALAGSGAAVGLGMLSAATWPFPLAVWAGLGLVFLAGVWDDLVTGGPRGLRAHVVAIARGRLTSGLVKMLAAVAGAGLAVAALGAQSVWSTGLGVLAVAGSANLWNGLDVVPGRAVKAFLLAGALILLAGPPTAVTAVIVAILGAAAASAPFDLSERGMLGDSGSNLLGYVVGVGLYSVAPPWALAAYAGAVVALNLAAETITLSRLIEGVRPLRWADRMGRAPRRDP